SMRLAPSPLGLSTLTRTADWAGPGGAVFWPVLQGCDRAQVVARVTLPTCDCDDRVGCRDISAFRTVTGIAESDAAVARSDHAARHWQFPEPGPLPIGGDAHRDAACRMFSET